MDSRPNVIWITVDSVRFDHTSLDPNNDRDTTPNLRRIASSSGGTSFESCFTVGGGTPQSTASILTGTYPSQHQLKISNEVIPEELQTLPELLGDIGYRTALLSRNSYLSPGTGLDRGFDRAEWISASRILGATDLRSLLKFLLKIRTHSAGFTVDTAKHSTPFLVNELAKDWLPDLTEAQPFFFYLHFNEPHRPYYPPLPYLDRYLDDIDKTPKEAAEISLYVHRNLEEIVANGCDLSLTEWAALQAMYDAEIAYTDARIGALFDYVTSLDLDDAVVVITADHGELFGEHGLLAHRHVLDDALVHVPLVVHGLESIGHQAEELVQHVDLARTLLETAGGQSAQFEGINLKEETRDAAFMQVEPGTPDAYLKFNPDFDTSPFQGGLLTAIRTHDFKYQRSESRAELFQLPAEETDVSADYPDVTTRLDEKLTDWFDDLGNPIEASADSRLTDAMRRQLRSLGYVE